MDKKIERIIELSDCEYIQSRWKPKGNDLVKFRKSDTIVTLGVVWRFRNFAHSWTISFPQGMLKVQKAESKTKEEMIWLPVNVNTETGNLQIDDLLIDLFDEAGFGFITEDLRGMFLKWLEEKCNMGMEYVHLIDESDIVLKLMWLRELIKEE